MTSITLPIDFRFVRESNVYKVVKDDNFSCEGCAFFRNDRCYLLEPYDISCTPTSRTDNCNVIFKKIGVFTPTNPDSL